MGCEVRVMGGFAVDVDGSAVSVDAWRNRRAADLMKLLAMAPEHRLHREEVMEALWPDLSAEAAGANLRKSLHHARRVLESADRLPSEGGVIVLCPDGDLDVDLDRFERDADDALKKGADASARVAATYGEVLPADRYEDWSVDARDRARNRYAALLAAAGDWEKILELDPTDEVAHRALMQTHLDAGNRGGVIKQFERLRDALRDHLGVGPDQATIALYDKALALEGAEPPTPAERVGGLLAHGLVAFSRQDLADAERMAHEARELALDAGLGHELGEASSLLALVAFARGTWHDTFRDDFVRSMTSGRERFESAVYDGHLCFLEYFLCGPEGQAGADAFARELLALAEEHDSAPGRALATLLLGEFSLLSGDLDTAVPVLREAVEAAEHAGLASASSIAMERLGEALVAVGDLAAARETVVRGRPYAERSAIPSHLFVRLFGVETRASESTSDALRVVREGERWMADAPHVCGPCSMTFRIEAVRAFARAGDLVHARKHFGEADRIAGMWQGGPWRAAVWEAQAALREAEGQTAQASALFLEAADLFDQFHRPLDAQRCRAAAGAFAVQT